MSRLTGKGLRPPTRQQEHLIDGIYGSFRPPCEYEKHPNEKTQKGTGNNIQLTNNALYDLFNRPFRDHFIDLLHQADRLLQADHHPLIMTDVLTAEHSTYTVFQPFIAHLVAA